MIYQLKNPNSSFPQYGWPFTDPRTGFICKGYEGTPTMHAVKIINHRRANPHVYSKDEPQWFDTQSVVQEIYAQKAATHPHLFRGFDDAMVTIQNVNNRQALAPTVKCKCGAQDFDPIFCKTCGGRKVTGYRCKSCGKELGK